MFVVVVVEVGVTSWSSKIMMLVEAKSRFTPWLPSGESWIQIETPVFYHIPRFLSLYPGFYHYSRFSIICWVWKKLWVMLRLRLVEAKKSRLLCPLRYMTAHAWVEVELPWKPDWNPGFLSLYPGFYHLRGIAWPFSEYTTKHDGILPFAFEIAASYSIHRFKVRLLHWSGIFA